MPAALSIFCSLCLSLPACHLPPSPPHCLPACACLLFTALPQHRHISSLPLTKAQHRCGLVAWRQDGWLMCRRDAAIRPDIRYWLSWLEQRSASKASASYRVSLRVQRNGDAATLMKSGHRQNISHRLFMCAVIFNCFARVGGRTDVQISSYSVSDFENAYHISGILHGGGAGRHHQRDKGRMANKWKKAAGRRSKKLMHGGRHSLYVQGGCLSIKCWSFTEIAGSLSSQWQNFTQWRTDGQALSFAINDEALAGAFSLS